MEQCVDARLVVAATGKYLQELLNCGPNFGVQVVTEQALVPVTDVSTINLLVVDTITVRLLPLKVVVHTVYVLLVFILVFHENVMDVKDALLTLMVMDSLISVP